MGKVLKRCLIRYVSENEYDDDEEDVEDEDEYDEEGEDGEEEEGNGVTGKSTK